MPNVPNDAFETPNVSNASFGTSTSQENATFGLPPNRTGFTTHEPSTQPIVFVQAVTC